MKPFEIHLGAALALAFASAFVPASAQSAPIDARSLPLSDKRLPASVEECTVWKREMAFAHSMEAHDTGAFAAFLHPGAVFNAGTPDADRGRDSVVKSWGEIVDGKTIALRWRPGVVAIGGEPAIAVSRGTFILQRMDGDAPLFRVGMDRAAAERWVTDQPMSDCAN